MCYFSGVVGAGEEGGTHAGWPAATAVPKSSQWSDVSGLLGHLHSCPHIPTPRHICIHTLQNNGK